MSSADEVSITYEFRLKPEAAETFVAGLPAGLKVTATRPGFRSIRAVRHKDDPTRVLLIERWASEAAYRDYLAWRQETGGIKGMADAVAGSEMNVWSTLIAEV
jgi:quinol monooxygenase YgiN